MSAAHGERQRAAAAPADEERGRDLAAFLTLQQQDRIQRATEYLTASGVWAKPFEENLRYIQDTLRITDAEVATVFERAQEVVIQPALEFLSAAAVKAAHPAMKVQYLRQKMGLHDEDIARCFERALDDAGVQFLADKCVAAAVEFLVHPSVVPKATAVKVEYLRNRLRLTEQQIQETYRIVADREWQEELARIHSDLKCYGVVHLPNLLDERTRQQLLLTLQQEASQ